MRRPEASVTCAHCIKEVETFPTRWGRKTVGLCRGCRRALAETGELPTVHTGKVSTARGNYRPTLDELDKRSPK